MVAETRSWSLWVFEISTSHITEAALLPKVGGAFLRPRREAVRYHFTCDKRRFVNRAYCGVD